MNLLGIASIVVAAVALVAAVPLGLSVGRDANARAWRRLWPVVGLIGTLALVLPWPGITVGLAAFYAAATLALALSIPARLARRPWPASEYGVLAALACPLVGAVILVADRLGAAPAGSLWWVASAHAGFAASMWAAARAVGPVDVSTKLGLASRPGVIGAALISWAALVSGLLAWWSPTPAAIGGAVVAAVGLALVVAAPARVPEPCEAQSLDANARLAS